MADRFLARRGLMAFASAAAIAEAGLLAAFSPAALPLAPQATALAPLAIFHDLRWLYVSQRPWQSFVALLAGLTVARAVVIAALVRLAWPGGRPKPTARAALGGALAFTALCSALLSPIVSLTFGVAILPFSWPYLASLPVMLAISATLGHGGVLATWWRSLPPLAAVGWLFADFAALSVVAALTALLPAAAAITVAGLAGLVNARAWFAVTAAVLRAQARTAAGERPERRAPLALLAAATVIAVVIAVTRLAFLLTTPGGFHRPHLSAASPPALSSGPRGRDAAPRPPQNAAATPARADEHAVLVVPGFGASCCNQRPALARLMPDALVRQFSYLGVDGSGGPLPHGRDASNLPLPVLGDRLAAQVARLHSATGLPVDLVAESEGTLGVDAMLAQHPELPVGAVVLLSPIVAPGQDGGRAEPGPGPVPGMELNAVVWLVGGLSPYGTAGAQTLIDSVGRSGARFAEQAARHRPAKLLEVLPLADAVTLPTCRLPASLRMLPALHGTLLGDGRALAMARDFLNQRPIRDGYRLQPAAELVAGAAAAWRMPQTSPPAPPCAH